MQIELTTKAGTTTLSATLLTEPEVRALVQAAYPGQFVELSMYHLTRLPFADCPYHLRGYVREGGTTGGRVLGSLRIRYAA